MKLVLVSAAMFLTTLAAQAMPAVGDNAFYEGTYDGHKVQERNTLMEFNAQTNQYRKETILSVDGQSQQPQEEWVNASDLPSDAAIQQILQNCAQNSGTLENVTVPAGSFQTCKLPLQRGGTANLGAVPFGVVKIDTVTEDGKALDAYLSSFSRGGQ